MPENGADSGDPLKRPEDRVSRARRRVAGEEPPGAAGPPGSGEPPGASEPTGTGEREPTPLRVETGEPPAAEVLEQLQELLRTLPELARAVDALADRLTRLEVIVERERRRRGPRGGPTGVA